MRANPTNQLVELPFHRWPSLKHTRPGRKSVMDQRWPARGKAIDGIDMTSDGLRWCLSTGVNDKITQVLKIPKGFRSFSILWDIFFRRKTVTPHLMHKIFSTRNFLNYQSSLYEFFWHRDQKFRQKNSDSFFNHLFMVCPKFCAQQMDSADFGLFSACWKLIWCVRYFKTYEKWCRYGSPISISIFRPWKRIQSHSENALEAIVMKCPSNLTLFISVHPFAD